jgi:hypothetical protein
MIGVAVRGQNGDLVAQTLEAYGGIDDQTFGATYA